MLFLKKCCCYFPLADGIAALGVVQFLVGASIMTFEMGLMESKDSPPQRIFRAHFFITSLIVLFSLANIYGALKV
jgi:hypothetical protein